MRPHLPSIRNAVVLVVDAVCRLGEAVLERADAVVCRAANDLSGEEE